GRRCPAISTTTEPCSRQGMHFDHPPTAINASACFWAIAADENVGSTKRDSCIWRIVKIVRLLLLVTTLTAPCAICYGQNCWQSSKEEVRLHAFGLRREILLADWDDLFSVAQTLRVRTQGPRQPTFTNLTVPHVVAARRRGE